MKAKQKPGVVFQPRVYRALQQGICKIIGAIRPTLGPLSGGVAIDPLNDAETLPEYLADGGLIARRIIELANRDEDMGAMLVRSMITRQHERVGDGTATVAVLFEAIFNGGVRYIASGGNAMALRRHLECAIPIILDALGQQVFRLESQSDLTSMARSLCHDEDLGALLGEAFDLLGEHGRLEVREDYGRVLRREYVEGAYFYTGLFSPTLLPEQSSSSVVFENPTIFVCDFEVSEHRELFPVMQAAHGAGVKNLMIIARNLSEAAVSLLVANNRIGKFHSIAVKLPGLNPEDRMAALDDLGRLTGAKPVIKAVGDTLENVTASHFGQARRAWADSRTFGIFGGKGNPRQLRQHIHNLRTQYGRAEDINERKQIQERIGNLLGGSITLWVGGFTESEISVRKRLAERTALVMRFAVQDGVVPGGGVALLNCRKELEKKLARSHDTDERAAYRILIDALVTPARTIFHNAGYDPSEVMAKLSYERSGTGFDVITGQVVNSCQAGILDSAVVLKACVRNAISTAALALTIDAFVHLSSPDVVGKPE